MKKILFVSKTRGFFQHLIKNKSANWSFSDTGIMYEKISQKRKIMSIIGKRSLFDKLGYIQVLKTDEKTNATVFGSYNRFLKSDRPYVIYLENPTALFHYKLEREESKLGKRHLKELLNDSNLKAIICMSEACKQGFLEIYSKYIMREDLIIEQIYPLINSPESPILVEKEQFELLFVAQGKGFVSKGGIELLNTMKRLESEKKSVSLTMICTMKDIPSLYQQMIQKSKNIKFIEFGISFSELEKIYLKSSVLVHLTRQDSFGLTILEAEKYGLPILSTTLYSIPELVKNGVNGFLTDPTVWFFDRNNLPNKEVWNNRKKTIFLEKSDSRIESFLYDKILMMYEDKEMMEKMSLSSKNISNQAPFSKEYILTKWDSVLEKIEWR